jgi:hypothetical protein
MGDLYTDGLVADAPVQVGDELDERFVQVTAHGSGKISAKGFPGAAHDLFLPGIEGSLQRAGEAAHTVDMSEELLIRHGFSSAF